MEVKGANLAEMSLIGVPVPPGFTITTEVCAEYNKNGRNLTIKLLREEVEGGLYFIENIMGTGFGSSENPCLLSVRSGARDSMPGMMDTVLDIGLNDDVVLGLARKTGKDHFAWDSYRRFIQMYGDVVMKISRFTADGENPFEAILEELKKEKGGLTDQEGVGELVKMGVERGRLSKPNLRIGICGEPNSVEFFHRIGMDYVSCSPYRVPLAKLAAAQAVLKN